jgi:hypothetical protein
VKSFFPRRWPVRWRIASVSAGLTLLILLCFALMVGRLATDKIRDDHRDEVQSIANRIAIDANLTRSFDPVVPRDGVVRIVDVTGSPANPASAGQPSLGPPNLQEVITYGDYEVATQRIATTQLGEPIYVQARSMPPSMRPSTGSGCFSALESSAARPLPCWRAWRSPVAQ